MIILTHSNVIFQVGNHARFPTKFLPQCKKKERHPFYPLKRWIDLYFGTSCLVYKKLASPHSCAVGNNSPCWLSLWENRRKFKFQKLLKQGSFPLLWQSRKYAAKWNLELSTNCLRAMPNELNAFTNHGCRGKWKSNLKMYNGRKIPFSLSTMLLNWWMTSLTTNLFYRRDP